VSKQRETIIFDAGADRQLSLLARPPIGDVPGMEHAILSVPAPPPLTSSWLLDRRWLPMAEGAMVVAELADGTDDIPVAEVEYQGRPAWQLSLANSANGTTTQDDFVIDRETGVLVSMERTMTVDGHVTSRGRMELSDLRIDAALPGDAFSTEPPAGYQVDLDSRPGGRCTLAEAKRTLGWQPPQPTRVPDGFALADVSTAAFSGNKVDHVTLTYRRGLDSFRIVAGPAARVKSNTTSGEVISQRTTELTGGTFAGATAKSWLDPYLGTHIYFDEPRLAVHIGGTLTRAEAIAVADSLQM
jgi:hypothetical protein